MTEAQRMRAALARCSSERLQADKDAAQRMLQALTVSERVPAKHLAEFKRYLHLIEAIETIQDERRPLTIADHDTTHLIW